MTNHVLHGDSLDILKSLPTHSVDSIITDPPAGINFMGKSWDNPIDYFPLRNRVGSIKDAPEANGFACGINEIDHSKAGRDAFIAFLRDIFTEARRVLKPGGHALVWSLPRTSHWTAFALEEAGFEIRDSINHVFGSGMPKSHNISKAIDKMLGAERKVVGTQHVKDIRRNVTADRAAGILHNQGKLVTAASDAPIQYSEHPITEAATEEAKQYEGYGTGLKPAHETWWLARSPLAEATIAANVLEYGTGALNIDASRVKTHGVKSKDTIGTSNGYGVDFNTARSTGSGANNQGGRWPSNVLLSHSVWCIPRGLKEIPGNRKRAESAGNSTRNTYGHYNRLSLVSHAQENGRETMEDYDCAAGCPIRELDQQSGILKSGARSHYEGKVSSGDIFAFKHYTRASEYAANQGYASRYFQTLQPEYDCAAGCPIAELNTQSGYTETHRNAVSDNRTLANNKIYGKNLPGERTPDNSYEDSGGAARFFQNFYYCPKPSARERNQGCGAGFDKNNHHPTVKSIALMSYLIHMITPPGGTVLDMFGGSGTTALACIQEGYDYILIERESEYIDIINARIAFMENRK